MPATETDTAASAEEAYAKAAEAAILAATDAQTAKPVKPEAPVKSEAPAKPEAKAAEAAPLTLPPLQAAAKQAPEIVKPAAKPAARKAAIAAPAKKAKAASAKKSAKASKAKAKIKSVKKTTKITAKESTMSNHVKQLTTDLAAIAKDAAKNAKAAYATGSKAAGQAAGLVKDNAAAVAASGKLLGKGVKDLGAASYVDGQAAVATVAEDLKAVAAVKSPAELFLLQGKIAARNFDTATAIATKNAKALRAVAEAAFAPLASRAKANLAAVRKAA